MKSINKLQESNKILIIKLGALGDLIIATPLIRAIIQNNKNAQIVILTRRTYAAFFDGWDGVSLVKLTDSSWWATFKILSTMRKTFWNKIYDFQGNKKSRTLVFFCNAREKIGNHRFPNTIFPKQAWNKQVHIFYRMKNLLEMDGIKDISQIPCIEYGEEEKFKIRKWINNNTFNKNFVILHAGSNQNRKNKRWPFFDLLAAKLNFEGYEIVWVGGSDDKDVNNTLSSKIGINTTGLFTIRELACLGTFATFAVTNDSAPMHILSSCNIPVFGIFGPSNKNVHHAIGDKFRAISSEKSNVDIASISINQVWSELEQTKLVG